MKGMEMKAYVVIREAVELRANTPNMMVLGVFSNKEKAEKCIADATRIDTERCLEFYIETHGCVSCGSEYRYGYQEFEIDKEL